MLYPNPFSLFCAIILCFPLALVLTITSHTSTVIIPSITHNRVILATILPPPPPPSPPPPPPPFPPPPPKTFSKPQPKLFQSNNSNQNTNETTSNNDLFPKISSSPPPPLPPLPSDYSEDIELLKRASRVNPNPRKGHPKKVAFLFLTTTPLPFASLWELFFKQSGKKANQQYNVYIHADPKARYNHPFTGVFSKRVIPSSKPTRRNTPTLITAARRLLSHALLDDPDNYMFTLLSGSCIPLHSFNFTYNTLVNSDKSFIEILSNETTAYGRWTARGEFQMLPEVPFEDFRIGSQFWSLTRRHARVVVQDVRLWRKFRMPCLTVSTCYPEENYFPTLLSMVDPNGVIPATLTNVNWVGQYDGHPRTYNVSDVDPGLIRWLRESRPRYGDLGINGSDLAGIDRWDPFLFARKFAPNCVESLLKLAKGILFKD
ncbi:glycosyltransferase BC10 [Amaranthus tricolor]|uniref:glycosyltransferase BC10 n=1 Tax=Amaranthus tricolor TaxID=29722 RepID=UPI0025874237|nr:glycosyltransferase BC10 [Amaranthus tricolor]